MTYNIPLPFTCRQVVFGLFALMHVGLFTSLYYTISTGIIPYFALVSVFAGIVAGGWLCIFIVIEPISFSCRCDKNGK